MSHKLEDVKGLGKKAEGLKEAGIDSVEKLANSTVEDLLEIKGIGKTSAEKFITNAKDLLGDEAIPLASEDDDEKKVGEELAKLEEKRKELEGTSVEKEDFVLVKIRRSF